jgi:excisionase family DNA binding protein
MRRHEFLTIGEVAEVLRAKPERVRVMIRAGELPAVRRSAGRNAGLLIPRAGLEDHLYGPPDERSRR